MTPEEHRMLLETRELAEENAKILRSIQRTNRISAAFKVLYWVIILGLSFGAYWLIQPYVDMLKTSLGDITGNPGVESSNFTVSGAIKNIRELNNLYKN